MYDQIWLSWLSLYSFIPSSTLASIRPSHHLLSLCSTALFLFLFSSLVYSFCFLLLLFVYLYSFISYLLCLSFNCMMCPIITFAPLLQYVQYHEVWSVSCFIRACRVMFTINVIPSGTYFTLHGLIGVYDFYFTIGADGGRIGVRSLCLCLTI